MLNIIVLNVHARSEERSDDSKESICKELEQLSDHFPKYHMNNRLGKLNAKLGREDNFIPTIGNESLQQDSDDNGIRIVNVATSESLVVKDTMFPHPNIHTYTWTSPDRRTHSQIDHI